MHIVLCVIGVWLTWTTHDYLQERVFSTPGFRFGYAMAFVLQSTSFILSLVYRGFEWLLDDSAASRQAAKEKEDEEEERRRRALDEEQEAGLLKEGEASDDAPSAAEAASASTSWTTFGFYLLLSLLIAAANGCATAALNFVSMQTKVLFKSSKIVTTMLLGVLCFGKFYDVSEYACMLLVVGGLAAFLLATSSGSLAASLPGVALLTIGVLSDSLVPNVQQKLLTTRPMHELVFHSNWISAAITLVYMGFTGEALTAWLFLKRRPRVLALLLLQSIAGYLGILAYLQTVRGHGSKVTVLVTSCRKLFTIGLSSLAFGHPLTGYHIAGVSGVFVGVVLNAFRERACSRFLVLPALLAVVAIVGIELKLDADVPMLTAALQPVRALLASRLL